MTINKITIVGGGTAGLISALILKTRFADKKIEVIKSDKIGIIGVGEGTTEHWSNFMRYVGIDQKKLIKECNATVKYGVMFEDWTDKPYFHNINSFLETNKFGQYQAGFGTMISKDKEYISIYSHESTVQTGDCRHSTIHVLRVSLHTVTHTRGHVEAADPKT